jgi:5-methylcytosine-specific restriction endonuclease McrA
VNLDIKREVCANPCAVCGRPDDIECDHIIGIANGGTSVRENLQPLCRTCNCLKRHHGTNEAVAAWIVGNPEKFKRSQEWRTNRLGLIQRGEWR